MEQVLDLTCLENMILELNKNFDMKLQRMKIDRLLLPTEGATRIETTKTTIERPGPSFDS